MSQKYLDACISSQQYSNKVKEKATLKGTKGKAETIRMRKEKRNKASGNFGENAK